MKDIEAGCYWLKLGTGLVEGMDCYFYRLFLLFLYIGTGYCDPATFGTDGRIFLFV